MEHYHFYKRIGLMTAVLSFICAFTVSVSPVSGATTIEDQSQFDKEELRKFRRGQLDELSSDYVIISDLYFLLSDDTEFYDTEDELEPGTAVLFRPSDDNKYVDELFPDETSDTEEVSASNSSDPEEEQDSHEGSSGEIRLENGVWVN